MAKVLVYPSKTVRMRNNMVQISLTVQLQDDITSAIEEERTFSAQINEGAPNYADKLETMLAVQIKAWRDELLNAIQKEKTDLSALETNIATKIAFL